MSSTESLVLCVVVAASLAGCGKEAEIATDPAAQLEQAAELLQQSEPQPAAVPSPAPQPQQGVVMEPPPAPPVQLMNQAVTAYKSGNYHDAVARLHRLRAQPGKTPEQAMAIQDALAAVMAELYALAAQGDARAQQAIDHYQKLQGH